jgi:outer membrane protein OmpA-like peptidoglycan-associated protein
MLALTAWPLAGLAQSVQPPAPTLTYAHGQKSKVTGLIVYRDAGDLLVRDETTSQLSVVTITDSTDISSPSGPLDLERTPQPPSTLIVGLIIAVHGTGGPHGNLVADKIRFRKSALRVATQIAAGEVMLKARERQTAAVAAANRDSIVAATHRARDSLGAVNARIASIDKYDLRVRGTVYFAPNSAELSTEAREILDDLFDKSRRFNGYVIEVGGFTDSRETVGQNLSARRAQSVVAYLNTAHGVPLHRMAPPTGFGSSEAVANNETPEGRARNRRVDVRVLVSRGLRTTPDR